MDNSVKGVSAENGNISEKVLNIPGENDDKKLYVSRLRRATREKELQNYFGTFGKIENISMLYKRTGQSKGYAFIVFSNSQIVQNILNAGEHIVDGKKVNVQRVRKFIQLIVYGITPELTEADLTEFFSKYGKLIEMRTQFDPERNERKGVCFLKLEEKDVQYKLFANAKQYKNGIKVHIKNVKVTVKKFMKAQRRENVPQSFQQFPQAVQFFPQGVFFQPVWYFNVFPVLYCNYYPYSNHTVHFNGYNTTNDR